MKRVIVILFTILFFASTAYATLPNQAVFNWIEYKFEDLFPKAQTVKSELTHDDVHYELRSWSGAWGTRYFGITDDGEIIGLGDYTDGVLLSFGYIDEWEDAVIADYKNVLLSQNVITSVVYSEKPNTTFTLGEDELLFAAAGVHSTQNMQGDQLVYYWPTYFTRYPVLPGLEFTEVTPDHYTLTRELPGLDIDDTRYFVEMDTNDPTIKRFAIADTGLELPTTAENPDGFEFGSVWIATDYGNGFEFEQISDPNHRGFYHNVAAYDIDDNGYDDLAVVDMGVKGGEFEADAIHTFSQYNADQFEQIDAFDRTGLGDDRWSQINTTGSVTFADLDNDGDKELIQGAYAADWGEVQEWGAVRIWELNSSNMFVQVNVMPREGVFTNTLFGASGIYTIDYNHDDLLDILVFVENKLGGGQGIELYRNDGNYQFTRVTDEVFPNHVFDYSYYSARELYVADVNNDGLDDIVCNPMHFGYDITNKNPNWGDENEDYYAFHDDGLANGFQYNIGSSIWLNTGDGFVRQNTDPHYTARVSTDSDKYPMFMRYIGTKNGVNRFFGFGRDGSPVVVKIQQM